MQPAPSTVTDLETNLLLEAVYRLSGYDFRDFAPATIRRRIAERMRAEQAATISGLQERVLHGAGGLERFIDAMTHNPTTPFAQPAFFSEFRDRVLPRLRSFPFVRIWVAGCGAGHDAYGLSILLREADFARRARIYATDASGRVIERAKSGLLTADELDEYGRRYERAGGKRTFADYLDVRDGEVAYRPELRENIVFAQHNLATDGSFNEFHLIVARSVLSLYNRTLAYRAHQVIYESLARLGFLGLTDRESLWYAPQQRAFDVVTDTEHFSRRVR